MEKNKDLGAVMMDWRTTVTSADNFKSNTTYDVSATTAMKLNEGYNVT
jgi:hypothetical protein